MLTTSFNFSGLMFSGMSFLECQIVGQPDGDKRSTEAAFNPAREKGAESVPPKGTFLIIIGISAIAVGTDIFCKKHYINKSRESKLWKKIS